MSQTPSSPPPLIDTAEVARQTGVTERTVVDARQAGRLGCVRIGRVVRYTQDQVDEWIAACTVPAKVSE